MKDDDAVWKLIGRKVNLDVTEREIGGKTYPQYKLNDPQFEADAKRLLGDPTFLPPGYAIDCSVRIDRVVVHIDADGIVTRIVRG